MASGRTLWTTICLLLIAPSVVDASWNDRLAKAVHRELDRAVAPQPGNEHLLRLSALRALRDDRLKPLLISLAEDADPTIQIHALLGLAELAPDGCMDLPRLQAADPAALESAILLGLDASCLHPADMRTLLKDRSITPATRLRLLSGLAEADQPVEIEDVLAIEVRPGSMQDARRAAQLATMDHTAPLKDLQKAARAAPSSASINDRCLAAMDQVRRMPSSEGLALARLCARDVFPGGVRRYALLTLLESKPVDAARLVCAEFERLTRRRHKVDLALVLLMTGTPAPAACIDLLTDDPLLEQLAQASVSLAGPDIDAQTAPADVAGLISSGHRRTMAWAVEASQDWPAPLAINTLEQVLDQSLDAELQGGIAESALRAASALRTRSPDRFRARLSAAVDDGPEQQLLLLALLQQPAPAFLETVRSLPRIGLGAADVLALLVLARDSDALAPSDVAALELVAASSTASESIRTQAAWLAVRHMDIVDDAVAALMQTPR